MFTDGFDKVWSTIENVWINDSEKLIVYEFEHADRTEPLEKQTDTITNFKLL